MAWASFAVPCTSTVSCRVGMGTTQKIISFETPLAETSLKAWGPRSAPGSIFNAATTLCPGMSLTFRPSFILAEPGSTRTTRPRMASVPAQKARAPSRFLPRISISTLLPGCPPRGNMWMTSGSVG